MPMYNGQYREKPRRLSATVDRDELIVAIIAVVAVVAAVAHK
jgi:hypothetical protein